MRSSKELEEPKRVKVVTKEIIELVKKENGSTSSKPEERKKDVKETIPRMILWGDEHEKLNSEEGPYILEMDEVILWLNENEKAHGSFGDLVFK